MILNKFNRYKKDTDFTSSRVSSGFSGSAGSSSTPSPGLNRQLWGNLDYGKDINGPIKVSQISISYPEPTDNLTDVAALIKSLEDRIMVLESVAAPVVIPLMAGTISYNAFTDTWAFNGYRHSDISNVAITILDGQMRVAINTAVTATFRSVAVLQANSGLTASNSKTALEDIHTPGMHFFEARISQSGSQMAQIFIREFHIDHSLDEGATASTEWGGQYGVTAIQFTLFGSIR